MKKIYLPKALMLSAALLLLLASCSGSGAGVSDGGAAADSDFELMVLPYAAVLGVQYSPELDSNSDPTEDSQDALLMATQASVGVTLAQLYILSAYTGWDDTLPSTYESGGVTYTWSRTGETTTWTYTVDLLVIMIEVTETGSLRDVEVTIAGEVYITGTLSADGLTGSVTLHSDDDPTVSYLIEWGPAAAPYLLAYTVKRYTDAIVTAILNIKVTLDGESGTWAYLNPADESVIAEGVWIETD